MPLAGAKKRPPAGGGPRGDTTSGDTCPSGGASPLLVSPLRTAMPPHGVWEEDGGSHSHSHSHGKGGHSHGPVGEGSCAWRWRYYIARVALRIAALITIIVLVRTYPDVAAAAGTAVLAWIHSLQGIASPIAFCGVATLFCAVSPTGYLPAVAAGIAFAPEASIPITYISVNLGAALNMALVRGACLGRLPAGLRERYEARGEALLGTGALGLALDAHPVGMVALLRLPFLANGALNYILSMRSSLPAASVALGNALGFAPGSVIFPMAGAQIKSLGTMLAQGPGEGAQRDTTLGVFFGVCAAVLASGAVAYLVSKRLIGRLAREKAAREGAAAAEAVRLEVREPSLTAAQEAELARALGGK